MRWVLGLSLASALLSGCFAGTEGASPGMGGSGGALSTGGSSGFGTVNTTNGLPCDVSALLRESCTSCHSSPPSGGAPEPLLTLADLSADSKELPGQSVASVALDKMKNKLMPPPPAASPAATSIAAFEAWLNAGMPAGSCEIDGGTNPYDTPLTCSSGATWQGGGEGSSRMSPGMACISCHSRSGDEAPLFGVAGTVYPTAHEPDNCYGIGGLSSGIRVIITDANGREIPLSPNSAGNFSYEGVIALPYRARVVAGTQSRAMSAAQTSGDCNNCHTQNGSNSAPGRIMAP